MVNKKTNLATNNTHSAINAVVLGSVDVDLNLVDGYGAPCAAIVTGVAGTLQVVMAAGNTITLPAIQNGYQWPLQVSEILSAGTSAEDIVVMWNRILP